MEPSTPQAANPTSPKKSRREKVRINVEKWRERQRATDLEAYQALERFYKFARKEWSRRGAFKLSFKALALVGLSAFAEVTLAEELPPAGDARYEEAWNQLYDALVDSFSHRALLARSKAIGLYRQLQRDKKIDAKKIRGFCLQILRDTVPVGLGDDHNRSLKNLAEATRDYWREMSEWDMAADAEIVRANIERAIFDHSARGLTIARGAYDFLASEDWTTEKLPRVKKLQYEAVRLETIILNVDQQSPTVKARAELAKLAEEIEPPRERLDFDLELAQSILFLNRYRRPLNLNRRPSDGDYDLLKQSLHHARKAKTLLPSLHLRIAHDKSRVANVELEAMFYEAMFHFKDHEAKKPRDLARESLPKFCGNFPELFEIQKVKLLAKKLGLLKELTFPAPVVVSGTFAAFYEDYLPKTKE